MAPKLANARPRRRLWRSLRSISLALPVLLGLGACANGPSDFLAMKAPQVEPHDIPTVRSVSGQRELERSLEAARQKDIADAGSPGISIGEMEALRGQQQGRVEALRQEITNGSLASAAEL